MWVQVRNAQRVKVRLNSADGDSVDLLPKTTKMVDPKFLWQVPDGIKVIDQHESVQPDGTIAVPESPTAWPTGPNQGLSLSSAGPTGPTGS